MRGTIAKQLRREATTDGKLDRQKYRYLKRQRTLEARFGGAEGLKKAQAEWGKKGDKVAGGKASPNNFKNNRELASRAGSAKRKDATPRPV